MSADVPKDIDELFRQITPIEAALQRGVRDALRRHKQAGNPVSEWRDGKVVWIPADQIQIPDEPPTR